MRTRNWAANGNVAIRPWGGTEYVVRGRITAKRVETLAPARTWDRATGKRVSAWRTHMKAIALVSYQIDGDHMVVIQKPVPSTADKPRTAGQTAIAASCAVGSQGAFALVMTTDEARGLIYLLKQSTALDQHDKSQEPGMQAYEAIRNAMDKWDQPLVGEGR